MGVMWGVIVSAWEFVVGFGRCSGLDASLVCIVVAFGFVGHVKFGVRGIVLPVVDCFIVGVIVFGFIGIKIVVWDILMDFIPDFSRNFTFALNRLHSLSI